MAKLIQLSFVLLITIKCISCSTLPKANRILIEDDERSESEPFFGNKIVNLLVTQVKKLAQDFQDFKTETRESLQELRQLVKVSPPVEAQNLVQNGTDFVNVASVTTINRLQLPLAALFNKFDSLLPSIQFNDKREAVPKCLSYEDQSVNAINTFGTCVLMYTGQDCTGHYYEIHTTQRTKVPAELEENNLSIGPCYGYADLHDKSALEGTPVQIFDSRKDGVCVNLQVKLASLNTHGTCVKLYSTPNCHGQSETVSPATSNHLEIQKSFKPSVKSISHCSLF